MTASASSASSGASASAAPFCHVLFASPQILNRQFGLSMSEVGLQFGLLSAALAAIGALVAGPLADWLSARM